MLWVAAMYNVVVILSMADIWSVLPVCKNCGYVVKFEHGRSGSTEDSGVSNAEYLVHLVCMNRLESFVVCIGKMAQDVGVA